MDANEARARVLIVDPATGAVMGECHGAGDFGSCPQAAEGKAVPCAGCTLVPLSDTGLEGWTIRVTPSAADACPLAFLPVRDAG